MNSKTGSNDTYYRYLPFVRFVIRKVRERLGFRSHLVTYNDLEQSGFVGLLEAQQKYNPEYRTKSGRPVKFTTFAYYYIFNEVRKTCTRMNVKHCYFNEAITANERTICHDFREKQEDVRDRIAVIHERLAANSLSRKIFELYCMDRIPQKEIGEILGLTHSRVVNTINRKILPILNGINPGLTLKRFSRVFKFRFINDVWEDLDDRKAA